MRLLVSLAAQLCLCVSGFEAALDVAVDAALASRKLGDVFDSVLGAPLERVKAPARTMVVVLDALDELPPAQLGVVLQLIVQRLALLPPWLRLFVTSRDTVQIKARLASFDPLELRIDEQRNREDVGAFLTRVARRYVAPKLSMAQIERIVEREFGIDLGGQLQARADAAAPRSTSVLWAS